MFSTGDKILYKWSCSGDTNRKMEIWCSCSQKMGKFNIKVADKRLLKRVKKCLIRGI